MLLGASANFVMWQGDEIILLQAQLPSSIQPTQKYYMAMRNMLEKKEKKTRMQIVVWEKPK